MKKLLFAFLILLAASTRAQNYQLIWSDEFSDSTINTLNWTHETGGSGWGNNELEYYTNRNVNSYIQNSSLVIEAKKESFGGKSYTSARMISKGKKYFTYGKIEARIKLPYGKGIWPAFWTLGENISTVNWPTCGEIDIMELIGGGANDKKVYGTVHWENNGHASYGGNYTLSTGIFADDYHVFSIVWNTKSIQWFVDGSKYVTIDITPAGLSAFHKNQFIILNLAVGGNWPGSPDATTIFPQKMYVDYVRVYQEIPASANEDEGNILPTQYKLENNFPNPFNPETEIGYQLSANSFVTLKVYDILGNEVTTLVNEEKPLGKYSVKFDTTNNNQLTTNSFPSGIYYYTLTAGTFRETKKMVFLK
ncbi:MAG: family 16 glycosylhydrolase [Ignavibacteriaceae bacterium]|nr:family 16 glycosylhydrolase [Ignavibacteriaceae bacterium]